MNVVCSANAGSRVSITSVSSSVGTSSKVLVDMNHMSKLSVINCDCSFWLMSWATTGACLTTLMPNMIKKDAKIP